jgi:hypothetical protein
MVSITAMSINIMVFWGMIPSLLVMASFKVLFLQFTEETEEDKNHTSNKTKLRGFSPQANYTDRATAVCRRS